MDGYTRGYTVHRVLRTKRFRLYWCTTWFPGYQIIPNGCGGWLIQLFIVPVVMIEVLV